VRDGRPVPSPRELLDTLDRLPGELCDLPRRESWSESADHVGVVVGALAPGLAARQVAELAGQPVEGVEQLARGGDGASVAHGVAHGLPGELCDLPRRESWSESADHYAHVIGTALPREGERAARLAARIQDRIAGLPDDAPTHGDFYEAQLLLTGGRLTGLLDVDNAGPGRRADDLGCLVAHLEVLALLPGWDAPRLHRLAREYATAFAAVVDRNELHARVAGVLLSLATGPHRVQEKDWEAATTRRLDAVERWLDGRM